MEILKAFMRDALRGHPDATPALIAALFLVVIIIRIATL